MENKINIAELLKDCPKGMELYSPMFGIVYFQEVRNTGLAELIIVTTSCNSTYEFYNDGKFNTHYSDSEMLLFPSKDQRDWREFQKPFKDGDIITCETIYCKFTALFKNMRNDTSFNYHFMVKLKNGGVNSNSYGDFVDARFATEEEKQKLFDAIKANGFKWNAETKTLEKLEVKKFDISTLVPFDSRVLVRDFSNDNWRPAVFGGVVPKTVYDDLPFVVVGGSFYEQCIPYEGNENLLGTTDDCDNYYKTWE